MNPTTANAWVDQVVHGYKNGHRQLTSSLKLDEGSAATMLSLSDLLVEPGTVATYLTGYPLREANRYVIARTWLAPEMSRPGCVWTHSLVVDYATLARLEDPGMLNTLFRRPSSDIVGDYNERAAIPLEADHGSSSLVEERLSDVLIKLYSGTGRALVTVGKGEEDEALALAVWRQMWPRLRRSFFFCTATSAELREGDAECVLQFLTVPPETVTPTNERSLRGLSLLVEDAPARQRTSLRRFMARYAADLSAPRRSAFALAEIHDQLSLARTDAAMADAIRFIAKVLPAEDAKLLKSDLLLGRFRGDARRDLAARDFRTALKEFSTYPSIIDAKLFSDHLISLLTEQGVSVEAVVEAVGEPKAGTLGEVALQVIATELSAEHLGAIDVGETLKLRLASLNPALYAMPAFWPSSPADRRNLLAEALSVGRPPAELFALLQPTITGTEAAQLLAVGDAGLALHLVKSLPRHPELLDGAGLWIPSIHKHTKSFEAGLNALVSHPEILEVLAAEVSGGPLERSFSAELLQRLASGKRGSGLPPPMLSVIALVRALERQTANPGDLIRYGLDATVHRYLQRTLPSPAHSYLDRSLPPGGYLTDHPLLARLIREIVGRYVEADRSDQWILDASDDLNVVHRLLSDVQDRLYGRRLLKGLQERTKRKRSDIVKAKVQILDEVLKPRRFW